MGQPETSLPITSQRGESCDRSPDSPWDDSGNLFDDMPPTRLLWQPAARALLNDALDKVVPRIRGMAERQIEALARQRGLHEIDAELVGLSLGGMASTQDDGA